jgi:hypothetical protein
MPDGNVGNCDITENKSQQNSHTKENKKQRKEHQNNEASKQDAPSENKALSKYKSKLNVYRVRTVNIGFEVVTGMKLQTFFFF